MVAIVQYGPDFNPATIYPVPEERMAFVPTRRWATRLWNNVIYPIEVDFSWQHDHKYGFDHDWPTRWLEV